MPGSTISNKDKAWPESHAWFRGVGLLLAALGFAASFGAEAATGQPKEPAAAAAADPTQAAPEAARSAEGRQPLATCPVHTIKVTPARDRGLISGSLITNNAPADDPLMDYLPLLEPANGKAVDRTTGGGTTDADADNRGTLRVLVTGPDAARVIDFRVLIDGESFRDRRRAWIEGLIQQSPARRQLRDAGRAFTGVAAAIGKAANIESLAPNTTETRTRRAPTLRDRLANYLAAVGEDVDRSEITALLNQWPTGPAVTVLSPGRSWQRAGVAPLMGLLDADGDAALSSKEITDGPRRLSGADLNQDGVVQLAELRRQGRRGARRRRGGRLVTVIDPIGLWRNKIAHAGLSFANPDRIATGPADLEVTVRFGKDSRVELFTAAGVQADAVATNDAAVGVDYGSERYEIAAVDPSDIGNKKIDQVAIGAALDGSPLLRLLDADDDQRLTIQEQRRLPELLASLDRDGDGAIAAEEIPVPVRIVVGRGAVVHHALGAPAAAVQAFRAAGPRVAAPGWFLPMDGNRDGVLTRDEFPGAGEQFKALDANDDGLISAAEAATLEG